LDLITDDYLTPEFMVKNLITWSIIGNQNGTFECGAWKTNSFRVRKYKLTRFLIVAKIEVKEIQ